MICVVADMLDRCLPIKHNSEAQVALCQHWFARFAFVNLQNTYVLNNEAKFYVFINFVPEQIVPRTFGSFGGASILTGCILTKHDCIGQINIF